MPNSRGWYERQTKRSKVAFLISTTVAVVLVAVFVIHLIHPVPSDGSSCVNSSEAEINNWVGSKSLPEGVSKESVENEVQSICQEANATREPQDFGEGLLHVAVEASGG